jgi:aryl-alcohol dehydrogenase-like predicted oxidoreductase
MEYRRLGNSDLDVPVICLGSWLTYGGGVDDSASTACVRSALDLGIDFFDTANIYAKGGAEEVLARALAGVPRDSYRLATKLFWPMTDTDKGLSRAQVLKQCDASLRRLQTDHIELYQCHRYDKDTPLEETMGALTELVDAGKVHWLGFSEWKADQVDDSAAIATRTGARPFVSSQPQYSALYRVPEAGVFDACRRHAIGNIVWSPLAQGVLTGKYRPGAPPPADSRAASKSMGGALGRYKSDEVLTAVDRLRPIADSAGITMTQMALAWVLRDEVVTSAIVGATRPEQVEANVAAAGVTLDADTLAAIDEALDDVVTQEHSLIERAAKVAKGKAAKFVRSIKPGR